MVLARPAEQFSPDTMLVMVAWWVLLLLLVHLHVRTLLLVVGVV
jgi:hypothetical protein